MRSTVVRWLVLGLGACVIAAGAAWGWSWASQSKWLKEARSSAGAPRKTEAAVSAAPDTGTGPSENLFDIMAAAPPLPSGQLKLEELKRQFPAFVHRPFDKAGFNAVLLPFSYSDPESLGDASEAMAFSALVSNDLDWSPGCYCARHAYFVFKAERDAVNQFLQGYQPGKVAEFIHRWAATDAVGGQIIKTADGYKGSLQVFDAEGKTILTKRYDAARTYWNLLGDMDVDAMTVLDEKPSQKLSDYLHAPRCQQWQSVLDLGSAALMEERSPEEFAIYEKIINADPGFSMVRHWYANQRHWRDGDGGWWALQNALALASRLEPASIEEFNSGLIPDRGLAMRLPQWLDHAEELTSRNHPKILACRLNNQCYGSEGLPEAIDRGLKVAAKYPNWNSLLTELAWREPDRYMAASLYVASIFNHYFDAVGSKGNELYELARTCVDIHRHDVTMQILSMMGPQQSRDHLDLLLFAFFESGHFAEAADLYPLLPAQTSDPGLRDEIVPDAALSAVVLHKPELLEQVRREQYRALAALNLTDVFQLYADSMTNENVNVPYHEELDAPMFWTLPILFQRDARQGKSTYHHRIIQVLDSDPIDLFFWITEDDYEKRDPSAEGPAFYHYLDMFFSYDPWVQKAVADFHKRGGKNPVIDPQALRDDIGQSERAGAGTFPLGTNWKHVLTPWRVATCVDQLISEKKLADAAEIARRYDQFVSMTSTRPLISIARELRRRVDAAQHPGSDVPGDAH